MDGWRHVRALCDGPRNEIHFCGPVGVDCGPLSAHLPFSFPSAIVMGAVWCRLMAFVLWTGSKNRDDIIFFLFFLHRCLLPFLDRPRHRSGTA